MSLSQNGKTSSVSLWPQWHENKPFALALILTFAFLIVFLMARTTLAFGQAARLDRPQPYEHQISFEGTATVSAVPDIATVTLGVDTKGPDVAGAQAANAADMNALAAAVSALGVPKEDMQTSNYSVYENTEWNPDTERYESSGWIVSQQLVVKVRDTDIISDVLDAAGKNGATSIQGPNFTLDDPENLKDSAREEAIADAEAKAMKISEALGMRLERVIGYSEWNNGGYPPYIPSFGVIADSMAKTEVQPGTSEVSLTVSVTYELAE
jgi:uncharacterized protein YggE